MAKDFDQLCTDTFIKIKGFGIKSRSVFKAFRRSSRMLKTFLEENNLEFSRENAQKWLLTVQPSAHMTHSQYVIYSSRRRAISLLCDNWDGILDSWRTYPQKKAIRPQTPEYLQLLSLHGQRLQAEGMAKATLDFATRVDSDFLIYLEKSDKVSIDNITSRDITGYFAQDSFAGRKPDGVKAYAYKLKSFLTFLEDTGIVTAKKLSLAVPKVFAKQESIVTVLSEKAVAALRNKDNAPDTNTFVRNHAMMLLALRLGIRRSDIHKLKLCEIDWKNDRISFVQQKTGVPITLPLLPDVGNALMDYILNFRPQVSNDVVFTRYYAPYQAMKPCHFIVDKCLSEFDPEDCPEHGYHILRRTCATKMLRHNIPRSVISASIGQMDPDSVDVYLSADEVNMRKCAISLAGIDCAKGDLA